MIFSLLYYFCLAAIIFAVGFLSLITVILLWINDFPNRRRFCTSNAKLNGKTAVVTGSNTGIGYETAKDLAKRGARVIMVCRNMKKADDAKKKIVAETGNEDVVTMQCDFSDLESVQKFCKEFLAKESALHLLVNNAGVINPDEYTRQKYHYTFGTNYVGPFLLTHLLLDLMKKSAPSRIVNVASMNHNMAREMGLVPERNGINLPQLETYEQSKLANVLHAKELTRHLAGTGVTAYSLHPGYIYGGIPLNRTGTTMLKSGLQRLVHKVLALLQFASLTPAQGAQTTIFCAVDESVAKESGKYYDNCRAKEPLKLALDADLSRRLWNVTLELVQDYTKLE